MTLGYTIFLKRTAVAADAVEYLYSPHASFDRDVGRLAIDPRSGEIRVVDYIGGSEDADRLWSRACMKVRRAWDGGELPSELLWVS